VKTIRLDIELYLRGGLGASLEEKGWPAVGASDEGGCGGSPVCRREGEERKREERDAEERFTRFKLLTSRANQSGMTESCRLLWRDWWIRDATGRARSRTRAGSTTQSCLMPRCDSCLHGATSLVGHALAP
jgi:hypothetical protein